jgi:hypothetical protein
MLFDAILPIMSSYHRSRCEGGIEIIIEKNMPQNGLDDSTSPPEPILVFTSIFVKFPGFSARAL